MSERPTRILEADLSRPEHQAAIILMVDAYARDPMGDDESLSRLARQNLIQGLREHPTTMIFLAYQETEPVGIAVCFRGFSTFAARPLMNISDYFVFPAYRGTGVGRQILEAVEARAREMGCCRLTLEVQENNDRAKAVYTSAGFSQMVHAPELGGALYLAKELR